MIPSTIAAIALLLPAAEATPTYPRTDLLVEPGDLKALIGKFPPGRVVVLDARGKGQYLDGHIPGARWVDVTTWGRQFKDADDESGWGKRIGALGIDTKSVVVVYGDKLNETARVWWILRYWGVDDVRLLHGGWSGWLALKQEPEKGESAGPTTTPKLKPQRKRLTTKAELLDLIKGPSLQLIDARTSDEHCGKADTAKRNGAIPGARNLEWTAAIDPKTGRFKPPAELSKMLKDLGIDVTRPVVAHCQSGGRSSVTVFTLELMGAKDARNYYRSWAEWGNADDTPIVKPKPAQ